MIALPGSSVVAPAEAGRQRDLGVALLEQRSADQVVERAVEIAAAVEQRLGAADDLAQLGSCGARAFAIFAAISASGAIASANSGMSL